MKKYKVGFLISHPVQYFSPLFKKISEDPEIELTVYYCSDESIKEFFDFGFSRKIKWDIPLLEGYKYKFLKNYSPLKTIFKPPFGLINFGIIKEIFKNNYDALIIHGWNYITCWLAFISSILKKTKIFLHSDSNISSEILKPKHKIFIKKMIFKFLFKKISAFLAISYENKEFYKFYGVPHKKIFSTPYCVDNDKFIKEFERFKDFKKEIRKEIGIPEDKVLIIFSGKLIEIKNPFDLIKAYEMIENKNKALLFIGDGILRKNLEKYIKERKIEDVYFPGFVNQNEISKYYVIGDIFVLPSSFESFGLCVNEAMCFSLPIIVSNRCGCAKDLVKNGENGFIFEAGNIKELSFYLNKLIGDKDLRERMGKKSFEIIKNYNYDNVIKGIKEALKNA
ncbi:MAG: glycosyltransferase family 4 protein [candidate division WOR-3 bacterium]